MKTHTVTTYSFDELSKEAQQTAIEDHKNFLNETMGDSLSDYLEEQLETELLDNEIEGTPKIHYDLGYSQGDGLMFEGTFEWAHNGKKLLVRIKHNGCYSYASPSDVEEITEEDEDGNEHNVSEKTMKKFEKIYIQICDTLEHLGYNYIEYELEDEHVKEEIRLNEYEYNKNGSLFAL